MQHPVLRLPLSAQPFKDLAYLLLGLVLGAVAFALLFAGPLTGLLMCLTVIGVPWLLGSIWLTDRFGDLERRRAALVFGEPIEGPGPRSRRGGIFRRAGRAMTSPRTWREVAYLPLLFAVSLATAILAVTAVAVGLYFLFGFVFWWALPDGGQDFGLFRVDSVWAGLPLSLLLGPPILLLAVWIAHGCALAQALLAKALLEGGAEERIEELETSRAGAVDAAALELRRIERDLHDGTQARLVALALDLGMARDQLERDPAAAAALLERSHQDAKTALTELRDLARGIHPAILTDRGLDAAVSALAARCPVPCTVDVRLERRLPASVESAAYFTIAESLANIAKHSAASTCSVWARVERRRLLVEVRDDGRGGVDATRGTGIIGLHGRIRALDGTLRVTSPPGGGTVLRAELPCES